MGFWAGKKGWEDGPSNAKKVRDAAARAAKEKARQKKEELKYRAKQSIKRGLWG